MSAPDPKGPDLEAILDDLYASEINASISCATLGNPKLAEQWALPTIRDAVLCFRDVACKHLPDSDFARKYGGFI